MRPVRSELHDNACNVSGGVIDGSITASADSRQFYPKIIEKWIFPTFYIDSLLFII